MTQQRSWAEGVTYQTHSHDDYLWWRTVHARGLKTVELEDWRTQASRVDALIRMGEILHQEWSADGERLDLILDIAGVVAYVSVGTRTGWIRVRAATKDGARAQIAEVMQELHDYFPEATAEEEVPVIFWFRQREEAAESIQRTLQTPTWEVSAPTTPMKRGWVSTG